LAAAAVASAATMPSCAESDRTRLHPHAAVDSDRTRLHLQSFHLHSFHSHSFPLHSFPLHSYHLHSCHSHSFYLSLSSLRESLHSPHRFFTCTLLVAVASPFILLEVRRFFPTPPKVLRKSNLETHQKYKCPIRNRDRCWWFQVFSAPTKKIATTAASSDPDRYLKTHTRARRDTVRASSCSYLADRMYVDFCSKLAVENNNLMITNACSRQAGSRPGALYWQHALGACVDRIAIDVSPPLSNPVWCLVPYFNLCG